MSDPQAPAPAAPAQPADQPPGFFARAEHAVEQILPGHNTAGPAELRPSPEAVTAALHGHAADVLSLVQDILELEAAHGAQAGLGELAVKALRVAGSVASIAGLAA